jgi:hypothetical protein
VVDLPVGIQMWAMPRGYPRRFHSRVLARGGPLILWPDAAVELFLQPTRVGFVDPLRAAERIASSPGLLFSPDHLGCICPSLL